MQHCGQNNSETVDCQQSQKISRTQGIKKRFLIGRNGQNVQIFSLFQAMYNIKTRSPEISGERIWGHFPYSNRVVPPESVEPIFLSFAVRLQGWRRYAKSRQTSKLFDLQGVCVMCTPYVCMSRCVSVSACVSDARVRVCVCARQCVCM